MIRTTIDLIIFYSNKIHTSAVNLIYSKINKRQKLIINSRNKYIDYAYHILIVFDYWTRKIDKKDDAA